MVIGLPVARYDSPYRDPGIFENLPRSFPVKKQWMTLASVETTQLSLLPSCH